MEADFRHEDTIEHCRTFFLRSTSIDSSRADVVKVDGSREEDGGEERDPIGYSHLQKAQLLLGVNSWVMKKRF